MSNKAWFFGDSFTYGHGCKPGYEYYDTYTENRGKLWTTIISELLNLTESNKGIPGNSNPYILSQIIENLSEFQKGDYVFITDTLPVRVIYPSNRQQCIRPLTTDILLYPDEHKNKPDCLSEFFDKSTDRKIVVEYIAQSVLYREKLWHKYYEQQFKSIVKHLNSLNIDAFFWSYTSWKAPSKYEYITKATGGRVIDGHWSWKGHKDFAKYIKNRIEIKDYIGNSDLI